MVTWLAKWPKRTKERKGRETEKEKLYKRRSQEQKIQKYKFTELASWQPIP
jgi:hypothetical protein